jgi:hypothetical protein
VLAAPETDNTDEPERLALPARGTDAPGQSREKRGADRAGNLGTAPTRPRGTDEPNQGREKRLARRAEKAACVPTARCIWLRHEALAFLLDRRAAACICPRADCRMNDRPIEPPAHEGRRKHRWPKKP